ncbi:hypothetical protein C4573_01870 [Candidatus Woesearchaeota archaeon]|nr:MAG: hypothetical protein C4573_01870 [Candidatus Woesearchaeota archaeon]
MRYVLFGIVLLVLVTACAVQQPTNTTTGEVIFDSDLFSNTSNASNTTTVPEIPETKPVKTIEVTEGDLVVLAPKASDPDGDKILFTYDDPLNSNGKWQTQEGDAGRYLVTVTADDGKDTVQQDVLIIVKPTNKAPVIECPKLLTANEDEEVFIDCNIFDPDGTDKDITVAYSGWMESPVYKTTFDDAGDHTVVVTATDKEGKSSRAELTVNVINVNRAPLFETRTDDVTIMEGDLIALNVKANDPDNQKLTITYSEPFDSSGKWQTAIGDAGTYNAFVTVSDGIETKKQEFKVTVRLINTAPVMKVIPNITVFEGETVSLKVDATDREGDKLTIKYSGWMDTSEKLTSYDDAYEDGCTEKGCTASYKVTITVTDGVLSASQDVYVFIKDKNRPPEFTI